MFRGGSAEQAASASSIRATSEATRTIDTWTSAIRPGRSVFPPALVSTIVPVSAIADSAVRKPAVTAALPADFRARRENERPERDQRLGDLPRRRVFVREEEGGHPLRAQHFSQVGQRRLHRPPEENPAGGGERFRKQRDGIAFRRGGRIPGKRSPGPGAVPSARRGKAAEQSLPLVHRVTPRRIFHCLRNGRSAGAGKSRRSVPPGEGVRQPPDSLPLREGNRGAAVPPSRGGRSAATSAPRRAAVRKQWEQATGGVTR